MEKYDVVIVGAGPAGSTAGYYIQGMKVLLVDRFDFPRHKACGGGLMSSKDWHLEFENYNQIKDKIKHFSCDSIEMYWDCKHVAGRRFRHLFDQVDRYEFDHLLLQETLKKENVSFLRFNLKSIQQAIVGEKKGYILSDGEKEIFTSFIVGADGFNSKVSKFMGNKPLKNHQFGVCLEHDIVCEKKDLNVHVVPGYQKEIGYGWIFPTIDGYQVGIGMIRKPRKNLKIYLDEFLKWAIEKELLPKQYEIKKTFGGAIPLKIAKKYCTNRIMLCGDAMGLVKVLTGEGIYYAMKSGKIAGETLSGSRSDLENQYKKNIKPVIKDVFLTPYIPPKIFTLTFWSMFFGLGKIIDNFGKNFNGWNIFLKIFMDKATHRNTKNKNSFYYQEKIEKQDFY